MNCGFNDVWDWQGQDYCLEDNTSIDVSKSLINEVEQNGVSCMFDGETTPVKACGGLAYHVMDNGLKRKELEHDRESSSQVKRRRVLQFPEVLDAPLCHDVAFLRSKETPDSLEDSLSEMSQWVAGFTEGIDASSNECLDPSSEVWISDCFNDADMHFCTEDFRSASGDSDVQIDVIDLCNSSPEYDASPIQKQHPANTHQNVVFKGKRSYMRTPPKRSSSVVYPFAFIKPCGVQGQVTLKDINQRIHNPPKPEPKEEPVSYPTSAFSGKPVVGKTKIHTEGGKGSITIMRTKG